MGSNDEVSNLDLCYKIMEAAGVQPVPGDGEGRLGYRRWIKYTHDRPFNDRRYAIDASKLRGLGWEPRTSIEDGLRQTAEWYRRFGETWWGDISHVLTPFPVVTEGEVVPDFDHAARDSPPSKAPSTVPSRVGTPSRGLHTPSKDR